MEGVERKNPSGKRSRQGKLHLRQMYFCQLGQKYIQLWKRLTKDFLIRPNYTIRNNFHLKSESFFHTYNWAWGKGGIENIIFFRISPSTATETLYQAARKSWHVSAPIWMGFALCFLRPCFNLIATKAPTGKTSDMLYAFWTQISLGKSQNYPQKCHNQ